MPYAATEQYPDDSTLATIKVKRAMIIIAHDDDMAAMTGTISKLHKEGWKIEVLSFPQSKERNEAHIQACAALLDTAIFFDIDPAQLRTDAPINEKPYSAIPKSEFPRIFNRAAVEPELIRRVREFEPSVVFTLDHEIGGYGHPEHVFLSQLVVDLVELDSIRPSFVYQSVYTPHMTKTIMHRHSEQMKKWGFPGDEWEKSKKTYGVTGMPQPTVQIIITEQAEAKMAFMESYDERERKTMNFYIPAFEEYSAEAYFSIFNREFFRVITK